MKAQPLAARLGGVYLPLLLSLAMVATWVAYLGYGALLGTPLGFPLDDSWIHQNFARHLAQDQRLYYNPGEPSTASTAPLWTVLLSVGYQLPLDFRIWAYLLGLTFVALSAVMAHRLSTRIFPQRPGLALAAALGTALEWHLAWAGVSGMETPFFTFLSLVLLGLATEKRVSGLLLGVLGGLAVLTRPEALVLLGLVLAGRVLLSPFSAAEDRWVTRLWRELSLGVMALVALAVVLAPYLAFNYSVTGLPLPSTFYAKHAAYATGLSPWGVLTYGARASRELLSGPLLLLTPGLLYGAVVGLRQLVRGRWRPDLALLPLLWVLALPLLYALQLPATYHHGRYLMPLLPILLIYGLEGTRALLVALPLRRLARVYSLVVIAFWLVLWGNGAVVYGWDVRFINEQEVAVAHWLRENTPAESTIATHDVGAIGYFSGRRVVDTAGLVTPELAPYVRDQSRLLAFLEERQVDYLAIFPRWYPLIAADRRLEPVFALGYAYAVQQGADNMVVLRARWRQGAPR